MEWVAMRRGQGWGFSAAAKTELWDRRQRGESLKAIGRAFDKPSSSIYFQLAPHGGIWGDAAYHTHARERALKAGGIKPRLMRRPNKHHPKLPARLARYNRLIGRRRAAVETTFATFKRRMGLTCIRYIGLAKASGQILLAAMAFNMRRWAIITA